VLPQQSILLLQVVAELCHGLGPALHRTRHGLLLGLCRLQTRDQVLDRPLVHLMTQVVVSTYTPRASRAVQAPAWYGGFLQTRAQRCLAASVSHLDGAESRLHEVQLFLLGGHGLLASVLLSNVLLSSVLRTFKPYNVVAVLDIGHVRDELRQGVGVLLLQRMSVPATALMICNHSLRPSTRKRVQTVF